MEHFGKVLALGLSLVQGLGEGEIRLEDDPVSPFQGTPHHELDQSQQTHCDAQQVNEAGDLIVAFDKEKCIACEACLKVCSYKAVTISI